MPPWDIGRPQQEFVRLEEAGEIQGSVLDIGCGTGENALYLAGLGHDVWGIDSAPLAIEKAKAKARKRGLKATFLVFNALKLQHGSWEPRRVTQAEIRATFQKGRKINYIREAVFESNVHDGGARAWLSSITRL